MKRLSQEGFSAVEGLLLLIIVTLVAGVGYYVYNQSQKQDATSKPQSSVTGQDTLPPRESEKNPKAMTAKQSTTDWKTYSGRGVTLKYPATWVADENPKNETGRTFITSPDFVQATELGGSVSGYQLEIIEPDPDSSAVMTFQEYLVDLRKSHGACGGDYKVVLVDGQKAIWSDRACHGPVPLTMTAFVDDIERYMQMYSPNDDAKATTNLFETILSTVKFN